MVYLGVCSPCQLGEHEHHYEIIQAVPEGVIGGARCRCLGECGDGRYSEDLTRWLDQISGSAYGFTKTGVNDFLGKCHACEDGGSRHADYCEFR